MQLRLMGTTSENKEMIEILKTSLDDKIKIISSPYRNRGNEQERIYIEIDLKNIDYKK